jgi:hypothetical protein
VFSEYTPEGTKMSQMSQILLNGNNVVMVRVVFVFDEWFCHFAGANTFISCNLQLVPGSTGPQIAKTKA